MVKVANSAQKSEKAENFENRKSKQVICDMPICFTWELSHVCNQSLLSPTLSGSRGSALLPESGLSWNLLFSQKFQCSHIVSNGIPLEFLCSLCFQDLSLHHGDYLEKARHVKLRRAE